MALIPCRAIRHVRRAGRLGAGPKCQGTVTGMYTISDEFRRAIPESSLSDEERSATAQAIARLMRSDADTETTELFEELRDIVPHEYFAYALFRAYDGRVLRLVNLNVPA